MRHPVVIGLVLCCLAGGLAAQSPQKPAAPKRHTGPRPPASARLGDVWVNPKDGAETVYVPAGEFVMGMTNEDIEAIVRGQALLEREWFADMTPQRKVYLDGFWMYRHEVTVAQYRKFCTETGRKMPVPPSWGWRDDHPIVLVSWGDAKAYADWAGVRLPTEAQWEKAARGTDGRKYVWGDQWPPPPKVGNFADETLKRKDSGFTIISGYDDGYAETSPVGAFPAGASRYGCLDMAGNAWEWCSDRYDSGYYAKAPNRNPRGPATGQFRVLRGGSWLGGSSDVFRCAHRNYVFPVYLFDGFRCARTD